MNKKVKKNKTKKGETGLHNNKECSVNSEGAQ